MLKILTDNESYEYLRNWAEGFREEVLTCPAFAKKTTIQFKDHQDIVSIFEQTGYGYKFTIKINGYLSAKGKLKRDGSEKHDFQMEYSMSDEYQDKASFNAVTLLTQTACTAFIHANAFLRLGNLLADRKFIASGRNVDEDKVIVFRQYKGEIFAIPVGSHRSPEGVFGVRGHFRRYKNGKVIWVDEYLKGTEKETPQKE